MFIPAWHPIATFPLLIILGLPLAPGPASPAVVEYGLTVPWPPKGEVQVRIDLPDLPLPQTLVMPRAIPMGYGEQPYDRFVSRVRAEGPEGEPLQIGRGDGPRWQVTGRSPVRRITYDVNLVRMEREILSAADASKSRAEYIGILGYSVFAYVEGLEDRPCRLEIQAPDRWPVFSTLAPAAPPPRGSAVVDAPDFYALADSQIALGPDLRVRQVGKEPPLYIASYAEGKLDAKLLGRIGREALDAMIAYFGGAPFPHYTIHVEILDPLSPVHLYGFSMEHLQSGTFYLDTDHGLERGAPERRVERMKFNLAHHIAHAWIPKRCYGEGYYPHTWELAPVLDSVWFSEGFVQYATLSALAERRGDGAEYRKLMIGSRFRRALEEAPAFIRRMPTVQLSRVASTRYSEDFRTGRNSFSRGAMMAAEMDDAIRAETGGTMSLRDALRHLYAWCGDQDRGFSLEELPVILSEGAGVDVRSIYQKWLAAPQSDGGGAGEGSVAAPDPPDRPVREDREAP
jgi:predicted metalloprotease with PDZ domain